MPFRPFVHAATLGRGSVPVLPDDVRRHIYSFTFPRPVLWCSVCTAAVLQRSEDGTLRYTNSHPSMWADTPRCDGCTTYPRPRLH